MRDSQILAGAGACHGGVSVRRRDLDHVTVVEHRVGRHLPPGADVVGVEEPVADVRVEEVREVLGRRPALEDEAVLEEGAVVFRLARAGEHRDGVQFLEQRRLDDLLDARPVELADELADLFEAGGLLLGTSAVTSKSSSPGR